MVRHTKLEPPPAGITNAFWKRLEDGSRALSERSSMIDSRSIDFEIVRRHWKGPANVSKILERSRDVKCTLLQVGASK
jgi:hypothetical protein